MVALHAIAESQLAVHASLHHLCFMHQKQYAPGWDPQVGSAGLAPATVLHNCLGG